MTPSRTILAIAAAAAIGSGLVWDPLALAQSQTTRSTAPTGASSAVSNEHAATALSATSQGDNPRSDARVEARITQLHKELKITKDQESDWNVLAQDMRDNGRAMSRAIESRDGAKPMNAADNLKSYAQIADIHAEGLKKIVPDFTKLYDSMSPAQKKTADTVFSQRVNQRVRTTATPSPGGHS